MAPGAGKLFDLLLPQILPDRGMLEGNGGSPTPLREALSPVWYLWGMVSGLDHLGIEWFRAWASEPSKERHARIILALWPGCPTWSDTLADALEIMEESEGRIIFRLLVRHSPEGLPANLLVARKSADDCGQLIIGNVGNFLVVRRWDPTDAVHCSSLDLETANRLAEWFAWIEEDHSAPLTSATAAAPRLRPAPGTEAARRLWGEYLQRVEAARRLARSAPVRGTSMDPSGDSRDSAATSHSSSSADATADGEPRYEPEPRPKAPALVPEVHPILRHVAHFLKKGYIVSIDDHSRPRPLDAPLSPELIGEKSETRTGTVRHRQEFRISIFDEDVHKRLERIRNMPARMLRELTLPLRNDLRWLPNALKKDLETELESLRAEAQETLGKAIGLSPESQGPTDDGLERTVQKYIDDRSDKIINDLIIILAAHGRSIYTRSFALGKIKIDLRNRILDHFRKEFAPKLSYATFDLELIETPQTTP